MTQWLKTLAAFLEALGSMPSIHVDNSKGSEGRCSDIHADKTPVYINNN